MRKSDWSLKQIADTPPWDWPKNAGEIVLTVVRDGQAPLADRLVAAELVGDAVVVDDTVVETLLSVLRDAEAPAELRGQAAISLGPALESCVIDGFDDPDIEPSISRRAFATIQKTLRSLSADASVPGEVRLRILEASVRAEADWHAGAIRAAYAGGDRLWGLTAVFCMRFVPGFDEEILASLDDPDDAIRCQAVRAAGARELSRAWSHVARLATAETTGKDLRLVAIAAVAALRPGEAPEVLGDLLDSPDTEIAQAVEEALAEADSFGDDEDDDDLPF